MVVLVAVRIPPSAAHKLIDDDHTICVTYKSTGVLASLFPLKQSPIAGPGSLELEVRQFTARCFRAHAEVATELYEKIG